MGGRSPYSLLVLNHEERHLSQGQKYEAKAEFTVLPQNAVYISGVTASKVIEMYARGLYIETSGNTGIDVKVRLFEDCQVTGGTLVDAYNSNRNSIKNTNFAIRENTDIPTLGIELKTKSNKINTQNKVVSVDVSQINFYDMLFDTTYILSIENFHATDTIEGYLIWQWTEEV